MKKKIYNISELKTIQNYARLYRSKRTGKVGVSRQYIEAIIKRGKNKDFHLVLVDGIKFIFDPQLAEILKNQEEAKRLEIEAEEALAEKINNEQSNDIIQPDSSKEIVKKKKTPKKEQEVVYEPLTLVATARQSRQDDFEEEKAPKSKKVKEVQAPKVSDNQLSLF